MNVLDFNQLNYLRAEFFQVTILEENVSTLSVYNVFFGCFTKFLPEMFKFYRIRTVPSLASFKYGMGSKLDVGVNHTRYMTSELRDVFFFKFRFCFC